MENNISKEERQLTKEERRAAFQASNQQQPPAKKPPLTKQEKRELQEQQRAKKEQTQNQKKEAQQQQQIQQQQPPAAALKPAQRQQAQQKQNKVVSRTEAQKKVPLFLHLKQNEREGSLTKKVGFSENDALRVHPSVLTLGLRYGEGIVRGADARCVAMLQAFSEVVRDFKVPSGESFPRALTKHLSLQFDFLTACRTHAITMGNSFVFLKHFISKVPVDLSEDDAKKRVLSVIDEFVKTNIVMASEEISKAGCQIIVDGDVILTFARSSVVEKVLLKAHSQGKSFEVCVIATRPHQEGLELLRRLTAMKIKCRYGQLPAISYMLQGVTKVFLGAGALFSNGAVLARAGTAMVAMMAKMERKPVLFFAESYKFSERVLLDSVVFNELGDPDELITSESDYAKKDPLSEPVDWRDMASLKLLNLCYDVTPCEFVDVVVTEAGNLPPSSVPVILRERRDNQKD